MKKTLLPILLLFLLFSCSKNNDKIIEDIQNSTLEEKPYFSIISKGWQHQFWQAVKTGAFKASRELDVTMTFEGPEGDFAVDQQIQMLNKAIEKNPAALIIAANDSKKVIPVLEEFQKKSIPIIAFDSGVDSSQPDTTVATDNKSAAALAADKIAEAISGKGEIAVICHSDFSVTGVDRRDGFIERIESNYPDVKIVDILCGMGEHDVSEKLMVQLLDDFPDLDAVFATNEGSAVGMLQAVLSMEKDPGVVMVGFDSGALQKECIRKGIMLGAVSQDPVAIGYEAVKAAYRAMNGETLEKEIQTGFVWYDKSNVDDPDLQILLYD